MALTFEQIENRLRSLVEESLTLFPGNQRQQLLAHKLAQAMQDSLKPDAFGIVDAPEFFTILFPPEEISLWKSQMAFFDRVAKALKEIALDGGDSYASQPTILLAVDPNISPNNLEIIVSDKVEITNKTTELHLSHIDSTDRRGDIEKAFLVMEGKPIFSLNQPVINIGRNPDNHLLIDDPRVSRLHAQIRVFHGQYILCDLNSTGGTYVNRQRISQSVLKAGDQISLAGYPMVYEEYSTPEKPANWQSITKPR